MKIALSIESNQGLESQIAHHFGRCPYFAFLSLEGDQIAQEEYIKNPYYETHQPGQVPGFINENQAGVMISGGMGRRALEFFSQYGIEVMTGAEGSIQDTIKAYLKGELQEGSSCAQSEKHHHGHGHHHHHRHKD
jgi:predicted Fe-Mo cluster-binding NifX family protein